MILKFSPVEPAHLYKSDDTPSPPAGWNQWTWQMQQTLATQEDFAEVFSLSEKEQLGFDQARGLFKVAATPYYASLASSVGAGAIRRILMPSPNEVEAGAQQMTDPLAEVEHSPTPRLIHRYSDRVIFLLTDVCSVYCRFCTRKRFTGQEQGLVTSNSYSESLDYIRSHPGIREVIFSGGDPLTVSNNILARVLKDVRSISHVEIIRIGSRMPTVCPMRIDKDLCTILRENAPVFLMSHFSHPKELTSEAAHAVGMLVDHGIPVLNQMVLINGVNNSTPVIQALNRRLLYLRVKPYYMFQCDPSEGTDHLRTPVEKGEEIMREMWGHMSGIAMPSFALDIPAGGGKALLTPNFMVKQSDGVREFVGWDGRHGVYRNPKVEEVLPEDHGEYQGEWDLLKTAKQVADSKPSPGERISPQISSVIC